MLAVPVAKKPARVVKARAEKPTRGQLATLARARAKGAVV
jgi:hypothetical protein